MIDRLALRNFMMFTGRKSTFPNDNEIDVLISEGKIKMGDVIEENPNSFDEDFINGINVFIGENATGKTTLLKCIYAACEWSNEKSNPRPAGKKFADHFSSSKKSVKEFNQKQHEDDPCLIMAYSNGVEFHFRAWDGFADWDSWLGLNIKSVFIPTAEMLSHSKGLLAMASKYDGLPFDATQIDILINAQLWETKEISDRNRKILELIGNVIDGEVVYEDDIFYVVKSDGLKVEFSLEADGFKKLGLLWKLIRNGLLESGSILLWDEPESSINPELIPLLVDILYILKNDGVQIFLATHNYTLGKYIDIKKKNPDDVLFISLYKNEAGEIKTTRANTYSELRNNPIEMSEEKLYEAIIAKSLGEVE